MAQKTELTPDKPRRRPGRPTREETVRRALAKLGTDPSLIDPRRILASIAGDADAPASARVAACKALLQRNQDDPAEDSAAGGAASINARAIAMMRRAN